MSKKITENCYLNNFSLLLKFGRYAVLQTVVLLRILQSHRRYAILALVALRRSPFWRQVVGNQLESKSKC